MGGQPNSPQSASEHVLCHARTPCGNRALKDKSKAKWYIQEGRFSRAGTLRARSPTIGKGHCPHYAKMLDSRSLLGILIESAQKELRNGHYDGALPHIGFPTVGQLCGNGNTMPAGIEHLRIACSRDVLLKLLGTGLCRHRAQLHTLIRPLGNVIKVELLHAYDFHLL